MKNLVLDVDTGIDDAIAILLACKWSEVSLRGISCVSGNVSLEKVLENTLGVLNLAERWDVPVAIGAREPLVEKARSSSNVHGENGLANLTLDTGPVRNTIFRSASDLYRDLLQSDGEPITFVALAPLTNLALFIRSHPEAASKISEIVFMGGSIGTGNASAVAEFNVWHDPEAAHIVLSSGIPITMYSLDAFEQVHVSEDELKHVNVEGNQILRVITDLLNFQRENLDGSKGDRFGLIGDAGAVITAVRPELATTIRHPVHVNLSPGIGRGQTQIDKRLAEGEDAHHSLYEKWPEIDVVSNLDREKALKILFDTIGN